MTETDLMQRAILLSEKSFERLDMPIGCVIGKHGEVVSESENFALTNRDFSQHAEVLALIKASKNLNTLDLSDCILFTTMEPCPMCSILIREYRIKKVVFSLISKDMGGYSKYKILTDQNLFNKYPHHFGKVPEISIGLLLDEAKLVWTKRELLKKTGRKFMVN